MGPGPDLVKPALMLVLAIFAIGVLIGWFL
jgi:hypothetical protein